jgi:5-methyltetrahydrofolate--homocysteine methyltransferase
MIIVGEKINASRPEIKRVIEERDEDALLGFARMQAEAGAHYIDVNVAVGAGSARDEADSMAWAVWTLVSGLDTPICLDSADPDVLEAGLNHKGDRPALLNSTKAEEEVLLPIVDLAARFGTPLVGLAMDESGIPDTAEGRIAACEKIADACGKASIGYDMIYFDPLVLPVSTDAHHGLLTLETISRIKERFPGSKTVMGLSNVSFGLPNRSRLNRAFLHMALLAGLDAAIADPLDGEFMLEIKTAEVLLGRDRHCRSYLRSVRKQSQA